MDVQQFKERKINQLLQVRGQYRGSEPPQYILPLMYNESIYYSDAPGDYDGTPPDNASEDGRTGSQLVGDMEDPAERAIGGIISSSWLWEVRTPSGDVRLKFMYEHLSIIVYLVGQH